MKTKFPGNPVNEFEQSEHGIKFEYVHLVSKRDRISQVSSPRIPWKELYISSRGSPGKPIISTVFLSSSLSMFSVKQFSLGDARYCSMNEGKKAFSFASKECFSSIRK
jgi:hypothetical protein